MSNNAATEAVAICTWQWRVSAAHKFEPLVQENAVACRASVGTRFFTVWLPQGDVIGCRIPHLEDLAQAPMETVFAMSTARAAITRSKSD